MKKTILIVGIILLSAIAIGALSYSQGWLPFSASDEDVLSTMIENMSKNDTWHSGTDITVEAEIEGQKLIVLLNMEEDTDRTDPKNPKSNIEFYGDLVMEGMSFSFGTEIKVLSEKDIYFRITTIPALPFLDMLGLNFNELKNQWIKIDQEYLGDVAAEDSEEMMEQLTELVAEKEFLIVKERFADEKINDLNCYHYLVLLDKDELVKILPGAMNIIMENNPSFDGLSESEKKQTIEDATDGVNEFFNEIGDMDFEIWIGKKDKLLYHLEIYKKIDISEISEGQEGSVNIRLKLDFSKFNEKINIEAPEEFKLLDEVFPTEMFGEQVLGAWNIND